MWQNGQNQFSICVVHTLDSRCNGSARTKPSHDILIYSIGGNCFILTYFHLTLPDPIWPAMLSELCVSSSFEEAFGSALPDAGVFRFALHETPPRHRRYLLGTFKWAQAKVKCCLTVVCIMYNVCCLYNVYKYECECHFPQSFCSPC